MSNEELESHIKKLQAQISEQQAELMKLQQALVTEKQDRERRLRRGANIAAAGASGTGIESFGDILQSSAMQEELDLLNIQSQGLLKERDFKTEARLSKARGSAAKTGAFLSAGSQILGGASRAMSAGAGGQKYSDKPPPVPGLE